MSGYPIKLFYDAMQEGAYAYIGALKKPVGYNGHIAAWFLEGLDLDKLAQVPAFFVELDYVQVPYHLQELTLGKYSHKIRLALIHNRTEAYEVSNASLFLPLALKAELLYTDTPYAFLIGFFVYDKILGHLGPIVAIQAMSQQCMMEVNYQGKALLIPYQDALILDIDKNKNQLNIQLPAGYLEAFL